MGVPAGRRKISKFEAPHHFFKLRAEVTNLMLLDFGFSEEKYKELIERYREHHKASENLDEVVERYEKKLKSFQSWFIDKECDTVLKLLQQICTEFTLANSIYPSFTPARMEEIGERRIHLDRAIAYCYALKQEINYIIGTLPVNMNKYERFDDMINRQIGLFKGVREADKRFVNASPKEKPENYGKNKKHKKKDVNQHGEIASPIVESEISRIPTYQKVVSDQNQLIQRPDRVPNTSKMNLKSFSNSRPQPNPAGEIKPILPGQAPPVYMK